MSDKVCTIRNYQPSDFENYARLAIETIKRDQSDHHVSRRLLEEALGHPNFHPQNDLLLAEADQNLIGYVSTFLEPAIGRALLDGLVHPLHRRQGVATALLGRAIKHVKDAGIKAAQICIPETNLAAKKMLSVLGLRFFRQFFGYKLDLTTIHLPDIVSGKYIFRRLQPQEAEALTAIQNRSFADTWGFNANTREEIYYRLNLSSCAPEYIIMVYLEDRPVAYCWTRIHRQSLSTQPKFKGEIHMLGVDPDFRRQSLGRNVLLAGLSCLKRNGVAVVELMADGEMPAAMALYESVGFEKYMRTEWYEKKL